ncbi:hypothetical protein DMN91_007759 [Ooceraea biroi]|uniref:Uncharacterized protein n=1 Tax=Ooceraea biroi TaxID=2015173 RepID=A0A3L8DG82_OOCBI|nr:hypothetical protein DMN91_007759 [Ooceraea biroi]
MRKALHQMRVGALAIAVTYSPSPEKCQMSKERPFLHEPSYVQYIVTIHHNIDNAHLCMSCAINPREVNPGSPVYVMRVHEVDTWDGIRGRNHSLVARIAQLEGLKKELETRFIYVGGGNHTQPSNTKLSWREIDTAFKNRVLTGAVINVDYIDPRRFLEDARDVVLEHVRNAIDRHNSVKVNTMFNGEFVAGEKTANKSINTRNSELFKTSDLQEWFTQYVIEPTLASLEEFQERDSGWALSRILNLTINVNRHNPIHAGCHIKLPEKIKLKKAVVNVQSMDNACFAWAVVAALHPAEEHVDRPSSYSHYTTVLNLKGIEFPVSLKQIQKFELLNDISVNVHAIQEKKKEEKKQSYRYDSPMRRSASM